jgi:hypothetical protein
VDRPMGSNRIKGKKCLIGFEGEQKLTQTRHRPPQQRHPGMVRSVESPGEVDRGDEGTRGKPSQQRRST